jgi:RNA polymerase sigma factor (sigma-70 family)
MTSEEPPHPEGRVADRAASRFPTTRWTLIRRIAEGGASDRDAALEEVCVLYWPPVYGYLRSCGADAHEAEDLTQGLFAKLLKGESIARIEEGRGRLRSYLLTAAKNYWSGELRRKGRVKRGGSTPAFSIDPAKLEALAPWIEDDGQAPPDLAFERLWAATVLETAYAKLAQRYRENGREAFFDVLAPSIRTDGVEFDRGKAAEQLGMSDGALRTALLRFRRSYGDALRRTVADTLAPGEDVEEELRRLREVFA